jgi:energy-coupling factor transporter ATP-binding protein EcfA2
VRYILAVFLQGLMLSNYRGIGPTPLRLTGFSSFNFFVGANNSGKSTILNFISKFLPPPNESNITLDATERHELSAPRITFALPAPRADVLSKIAGRLEGEGRQLRKNRLDRILEKLADKDGFIWAERDLPGEREYRLIYNKSEIVGAIGEHEWQQLWSSLTGAGGGGRDAHWIPETLNRVLGAVQFDLPKPILIPAMRRIGGTSTSFSDYSGNGLIVHLAQMQNPALEHLSNNLKFKQINGFVRDVTGRENAAIEIPHNREYILVHMDGRILPLSSLGTGIEEVIMLAAFCTLATNTIVCIEEPEIHLHPLLQRKLINYLQRNTSNQYFIATHSASFIDTPGAAVFHVKLAEGKTVMQQAVSRQEKFEICADLGCRASDILQANAVIWVEGPSDRIYLNYWFRHCDPELIEGLHYSIMFYGGRLLSHLSANDSEVDDFIQLRTLNRQVAILMDSDKAHKSATINATKQRIQEEFKVTGVAWVTKGREIENYIPHTRLQDAVRSIYSNVYDSPADGGVFAHALHFKRATPKKRRTRSGASSHALMDDGIERDVDKIKVSHAVAAAGAPDLAVLDLADRLQDLVNLVRLANSMPPKQIRK